MRYEDIAEKVKNIILEKKPLNLLMTVQKNEVLIYTDEGLVEKIKFQEESKEEEKEIKEEKKEVKIEVKKRSTK